MPDDRVKILNMDEILQFLLNRFWLFALCTVFSLLVCMYFVAYFSKIVLLSILPKSAELARKIVKKNKWPFQFVLTGVALLFVPFFVDMSNNQAVSLQHLAASTLSVALLWSLFNTTTLIIEAKTKALLEQNQRSAAFMLPFIQRLIKIFATLLVILFLLQNYGIDIRALLAGLGIGGLAIALAGKNTIENLFGGMVLMLDQPVKVGDSCAFANFEGVVEDIGIRSTRVRTTTRTLLTIPNGEFSQMKIENLAKRDRMRFFTILKLRYDTLAPQLREIIDSTRKFLEKHNFVSADGLRVRLSEFGEYAIHIEIQAFILVEETSEFVIIREELLFELMKIIQNAKANFAYPSQSIFLEKPEDQA